VLGLVVGETDDAAVAEDDPGRIELGLPAHVDVADLDVRPFGRGHAKTLVHHVGVAHQLHDHVATPVVGELLDRLDAVVRRLVLPHVHHVGGPEGARQGQALLHAVDDDDTGGPHLLRHRARVDPEAARTLDDHGLPRAHGRDVEARVDLGEGAVDTRGHVVGDVVGQLEDRVIGPQVKYSPKPP
jgi:hypothetical protein